MRLFYGMIFKLYYIKTAAMKDEQNKDEKPPVESGEQGRAKYHKSSTTQGGSNHGQGSMHLGNESYRQGSEKNDGANYENEDPNFDNEDNTAGTIAPTTDNNDV